jgi:hypothetical protein
MLNVSYRMSSLSLFGFMYIGYRFESCCIIFFVLVVYKKMPQHRVTRWHIFEPKIPTWVNFRGFCNGQCWYNICPFGLFNGYLVYFLWPFGIFYGYLVYFSSFLVCCSKKNLATLPQHWKYIQSLSRVHSVKSLVESGHVNQ